MQTLRAKILTIALVFLSLISAIFLIYSIIATDSYKEQRLESINRWIEYEAERVNKAVAVVERGAVSYALLGKYVQESRSRELGENLVLDYIKSFIVASGGGFWYEPYVFEEDSRFMCFYAYNGEEPGSAVLGDAFMNGFNYHEAVWYGEIIGDITQPHRAVWTLPYFDEQLGKRLTTAGAGIFDNNGNLIGISTIDWDLDLMLERLYNLKPTENSFIILADLEKGYGITNTMSRESGRPVSDIWWDIYADSFVSPHTGIEYLIFRRQLDNGWTLLLQAPTKEVFEAVDRKNNGFLFVMLFSISAILLGAYYIISRIVNRPLKQLTDEVSQLNLGNLDISVQASTNDELGLLARTFNTMASDLKDSIEAHAKEREENERIGAELNIAAGIQASMLPGSLPDFSKWQIDIRASMLPAKEVGGDFYDFFLVDSNTLALVIADVSGKGVPAALFMVVAKTLIKNNAQLGKSPQETFEAVNNILCENNEAGMFVTAFMGFLDISSGRFSYVNAGHNLPMLLSGGSFKPIPAKPGVVLAGMEDMVYRQEKIILSEGDALYLYTDGVTEAMDTQSNLFSEERLQDILNVNRESDLGELLACIKSEIDAFADGAEQADDITMLAMRYLGVKQ